MKPNWKYIYPWIKAAVLNLESVDSLLQEIVERIAAIYEADCLLWAGLELGASRNVRVYATAEAIRQFLPNAHFAYSPYATQADLQAFQHHEQIVLPYRPESLPLWLLDQQYAPKLTQLDSGDLIVPVTIRGGFSDPSVREFMSVANPLQFVLQLIRPSEHPAPSAAGATQPFDASEIRQTKPQEPPILSPQNEAWATETLPFPFFSDLVLEDGAIASSVSHPKTDSAEDPSENPAEDLTQTLVENPAEDLTENFAKGSTKNLTEDPTENSVENSTEDPTEDPTEDLAEDSAEKLTEDPAELSAENPAEPQLGDSQRPIADPTFDDFVTDSTPLSLQGWTLEELDSLEVVCSQLGLAYSALYWRHRLDQARQQSALIGRISRLLNSTLNPDEIVGRIVAEMGYSLQCDRSILVDLRHEMVNVLSIWDHPERQFMPIERRQSHRDYWQNVIEMFLQGGASYLEVGITEPNPDSLKGWLHEIGAQSVLLVPMFIQEDFFGAVALLSYERERSYSLDELQAVRQAADQAAIALTNAQHYQSLWHKKEILQLQNNSLRMEIMRDELTQLLNRRALEQELEQLSNSNNWATQPTFSIIVCDIDHFKKVNDTYGHLTGDEMLQALAHRLQNQLRRETPAYRYGGEEFIIILNETKLDKAIEVAERLRLSVQTHPVRTKSGLINATASFGVAQQDVQYDHSAWDVLQRADEALYEAKGNGRDRVAALKPPCPARPAN
jgi:diguanylate cyclase (GGDEF)-like protein